MLSPCALDGQPPQVFVSTGLGVGGTICDVCEGNRIGSSVAFGTLLRKVVCTFPAFHLHRL